jgi:hypothetical protein
MNTRLKELYEQASTPPWHPDDQGSFDVEKFAEMIIRECAQKAAQMRHVYPHQAELTATTILDHFGVKP